MKPTDVKTGTVTIKNTGDLAGKFTLAMIKIADDQGTNAGHGHLYDVLQLKIEDGSTVVYNGALAASPAGLIDTYAPGESHTFTFTVTFPDGGTPGSNTTGDNVYQGSTTTVEFDWTAVQH